MVMKYFCDQCDKELKDRLDFELYVTKPEDEYVAHFLRSKNTLKNDFCSFDCGGKYIQGLLWKKEEKDDGGNHN